MYIKSGMHPPMIPIRSKKKSTACVLDEVMFPFPRMMKIVNAMEITAAMNMA